MLRLNVVTPERPFLQEECVSVTLPGKAGEMEVLAGHVALLSELNAGVITLQKSDRETVRFMVGEGVVEINNDQVNVLAETARYKSEIDAQQEEEVLIGLQEAMKKLDNDDGEHKRVTAELSRCVAKLRLFE